MTSLHIAEGSVFHGRSEIVTNAFRYPIFYIHFDCREEGKMRAILGRKTRHLLSFSAKDYLLGKDQPLTKSIKEFLKKYVNYEMEKVVLQTMPRMFGYAFNPVNFWLCYRAEKLDAVLCEVHNTFGEKHYYWLHKEGGISANDWMSAHKMFHVSPFFPVDGSYKFRFDFKPNHFLVDIHHFNEQNQLRLKTWTKGELRPLESINVFKILLRYGWMTPLVVLRIHFQAFKLWRKGAQFFSKPSLPEKEVTL